VPIKCFHGCLYVRISAHVYNELGDYVVLANVIEEIILGRGIDLGHASVSPQAGAPVRGGPVLGACPDSALGSSLPS
jgi:hypothetical protein